MLIDSVDPNKVIREKALKRLYELSLKTVGKKAQLDKPDYEQEQWANRRMWGEFS